MSEKKITNHIMALKLAMAKKQAASKPSADDAPGTPPPGRAPVMANKPQKRVTGRGR